MSQENTAQQEQTSAEVETQTAEGNAFTPITSLEQLDKVIGGRINGIKSKYADYDDLKAKAQKFDELEEAIKTELERAQSLN